MKFRILSVLFLFVLFVHHSREQSLDSNHIGIPKTQDGDTANGAPVANNGLANILRNGTSSILQRLEGPRDRVLEFIKPAVKSDFSRNVTKVLNSIWSRVQESNSSIIRNQLFRNSIVIPINTTLSRLKEITADENESPNLEIINLEKPEDEAHLREYLKPSSSGEEAASDPPVLLLFKEEDSKPSASENIESTESAPVDQSHDEVSNNDVRVNDSPSTEQSIEQQSDNVVNPPSNNPTKSVKKA